MPATGRDGDVDAALMRRALRLARAARKRGEVPVGAVAVRDGAVIAAASNRMERSGDATAHAEMLVLRRAAAVVGGWRLGGVTMVMTLEPCPMCAGAVWAARIGLLVYGAADPRAGAAGSLYNFAADPRLNHTTEVVRGVRAADCAALLTEFFENRR